MTTAPKYFLNEVVTMDDETRTVEEWCVVKKIEPLTAYRRRMKACTWKETFTPLTLKQHRAKLARYYSNSFSKKTL